MRYWPHIFEPELIPQLMVILTEGGLEFLIFSMDFVLAPYLIVRLGVQTSVADCMLQQLGDLRQGRGGSYIHAKLCTVIDYIEVEIDWMSCVHWIINADIELVNVGGGYFPITIHEVI